MKRLIVNADDFGFSTGCNRGIISALKEGIVTSTTIMVTGEAFVPAADWAKKTAAPVGLHLCITYGRPVAALKKVASLLDSRGFFRRPDKHTQPDPIEVETEWRAQIEKLLELGVKPDHLDSHHYMHEVLGDEILALAVKLAKEISVPLRQTTPVGREYCRRAGVPTTDVFTREFYGEGATVERLTEILYRPWEGVMELMCHPAETDQMLLEKSSYTIPRSLELAALLSAEARRVVREEKIELINFSSLGDKNV